MKSWKKQRIYVKQKNKIRLQRKKEAKKLQKILEAQFGSPEHIKLIQECWELIREADENEFKHN